MNYDVLVCNFLLMVIIGGVHGGFYEPGRGRGSFVRRGHFSSKGALLGAVFMLVIFPLWWALAFI